MWSAFPTSDYYGDSATLRHHQLAVSLPAAHVARGREGRCRSASHVHRAPVDRGGVQLYPCSIASGQPQLSLKPRRRDRYARRRDGVHGTWRTKRCHGPYPPDL